MNPEKLTEFLLVNTRCTTAIAQESDFVELRRRYLSFTVPATIAFMTWYILYIICTNWARDFMDTKVVGNINIALVWGLLQFVSTFTIAYFYARHAREVAGPFGFGIAG